MAAHLVKCLYCGETFDTNIEPFVKPRANRYAHARCAETTENKEQAAAAAAQKGVVPEEEKADYQALKDYINSVFSNINWPTTISKMHQLRLQNYTYSGMLKSLKWWYEIQKKNPKDAKTPLGIIPFIYNDAYAYYEAIFLAEEKNKAFQYTEKVREFTITPPEAPKLPPRLFDLGED